MERLVSIIIPVYNVEKYVSRCLESVVSQIYKNIEIIVVDDGSPDGSAEIIEKYCKRDSRVKLYHKINGGLSDARNFGLSKAKGDYVTYIDSDDFVTPDYVLTLVEDLENYHADISCVCKLETSDDRIPVDTNTKLDPFVLSGYDTCLRLLNSRYYDYLVTAWGKLYKREIVERFPFPIGKNHEDEATTALLYYGAKKVSFNSKICYGYYINYEGITKSNKNKKNDDYIWSTKFRATYFEKLGEETLAKLSWKKYYSHIFNAVYEKCPYYFAEIKENTKHRCLLFQTRVLLYLARFSPILFRMVWKIRH